MTEVGQKFDNFSSFFLGDRSQGAASPVPLKKDVENMEKGKECLFK